jgi:hypothetical protein
MITDIDYAIICVNERTNNNTKCRESHVGTWCQQAIMYGPPLRSTRFNDMLSPEQNAQNPSIALDPHALFISTDIRDILYYDLLIGNCRLQSLFSNFLSPYPAYTFYLQTLHNVPPSF